MTKVITKELLFYMYALNFKKDQIISLKKNNTTFKGNNPRFDLKTNKNYTLNIFKSHFLC